LSEEPEKELEDFKYEGYRIYVILMGGRGGEGCTLSLPD
jgi:hypothetical protein